MRRDAHQHGREQGGPRTVLVSHEAPQNRKEQTERQERRQTKHDRIQAAKLVRNPQQQRVEHMVVGVVVCARRDSKGLTHDVLKGCGFVDCKDPVQLKRCQNDARADCRRHQQRFRAPARRKRSGKRSRRVGARDRPASQQHRRKSCRRDREVAPRDQLPQECGLPHPTGDGPGSCQGAQARHRWCAPAPEPTGAQQWPRHARRAVTTAPDMPRVAELDNQTCSALPRAARAPSATASERVGCGCIARSISSTVDSRWRATTNSPISSVAWGPTTWAPNTSE